MSHKKWNLLLMVSVVLTLALFAGAMYLLDPVLNYGTESSLTSYYEYSTIYTNPGIARHYTYDAVLVGTSMIQNTDVDLCEELLDCRMVRLPYSGGTSYDMRTILELCFDSGNDIETVYWELDQFQLDASATEHRYPVPEYLYNSDVRDDISYLLNMDIMYHYGLNNILGSLKGAVSPAARRGITLYGTYDRESTLDSYRRPALRDAQRTFQGAMQAKTEQNLSNITALVEAHSDTEFVFFMPPFSILYWDRELRSGTFDATMEATEYALATLLEYDNVRVYYYQMEEDVILDLDNYKDYSHYGNWINDTVTAWIAQDYGRVTRENYAQVIGQMSDFVHGYDFDSLFAQ